MRITQSIHAVLFLFVLSLVSCGEGEIDYGPEELDREGAAIDAAPVERDPKDKGPDGAEYEGEYRVITIADVSLEDLGMEGIDDLLDAQLFPDEYTDEERKFPDHIAELDGKKVKLKGYMIPTHTEEGQVMSFMVVGDLLACCFGGAPSKDQWVNVEMNPGKSSEYYAYVPMSVKGVFRIQVIEDMAGYPTGCYIIEGESSKQEL